MPSLRRNLQDLRVKSVSQPCKHENNRKPLIYFPSGVGEGSRIKTVHGKAQPSYNMSVHCRTLPLKAFATGSRNININIYNINVITSILMSHHIMQHPADLSFHPSCAQIRFLAHPPEMPTCSSSPLAADHPRPTASMSSLHLLGILQLSDFTLGVFQSTKALSKLWQDLLQEGKVLSKLDTR